MDANEAKVYQKLAQLDAQLNQPAPAPTRTSQPPVSPQHPIASQPAEAKDRLETLAQQGSNATAPDPELEQLNNLMEKVLDIQQCLFWTVEERMGA